MKNLALAALMLAGSVVLAFGDDDRMALSDIRPGMTGIGLTVFEGTKVEQFTVQIIGVLRNINGPKRNLILARLEGGPLANTGVIAGMSGSPIYIGGQLVGALSYALGSFTTEPIAGITPIQEMLDAVQEEPRRSPIARATVELPMSPERLIDSLRSSLRSTLTLPLALNSLVGNTTSPTAISDLGVALRPITTPLSLSGFSREVTGLLASTLQGTGISAVPGGEQTDNSLTNTDALRPGDAVSITLVDGDLSLAGTGTVTLIENDNVYAFGHQFQNLGPVQFPMNRAYVHTTLPSLLASTKIATVGEPIGTFQQDRMTGITGTLGAIPRGIPIDITLRVATSDQLGRQFKFNIVDDQILTPLLTFLTVLNTLQAYERDAGAATLAVSGTATFENYTPLVFNDVFTGGSPSLAAATSLLTPITLLVQNEFAPISLKSLTLEISASEEIDSVTIERVWFSEKRFRAGQEATLNIATRNYRGIEQIRSVPIRIPANAPPTVSLLVSAGSELTRLERQETQNAVAPRNLDQLIRLLNEGYRNNRLYLRLLSTHPGVLVAGEQLAALPPSALAVYQADRSRGSMTPLHQLTLGAWEIDTKEALSGARVLTLDLDSP